MLEKEWNINVL